MLKNDTYLTTYIDYLYRRKFSADELKLLHPIDHLLSIALPSVGMKWFPLLRLLGINYSTECMRLKSYNDRLLYTDNYKLSTLVVSNNAYILTSNNEIISKEGKIHSTAIIYKDKDMIKNCVVCFNHTISKKDYYKLLV